ncbi:MAG TPA: glycosyltransferase family 1 protein [Streptosporangiales bacterium]
MLIDGTDRGGVNRYVDGLVQALDKAGAEIAVACQRADADRYGRMAPHASIVTGPSAINHRPARLAWEQTGLPVVADSFGADVIHAPFYTMPVRPGRPVVVTVHDVTAFTKPELITSVKATFLRSAIRTAARRATRIIVPSKATRDELVEHLSADADRIDVAYHGVDHELFHRPSPEQCERVSNRLGLHGQPYVAFLGGFEPRKNVPNLIRGWVQAVADRDQPPALVLAGSRGSNDDEIDDAVVEVPEHLRVIRPGFLRYVDLPSYLGGALVVAFPSHGEGFGLPVLEAMACGAPVLTTHRTSLPEVGGEAVAYTEPDAESIGNALAELLDSPERRQSLAEAGYERSQDFTWRTSAETHMASYRRAVEDHRAAS